MLMPSTFIFRAALRGMYAVSLNDIIHKIQKDKHDLKCELAQSFHGYKTDTGKGDAEKIPQDIKDVLSFIPSTSVPALWRSVTS